MNFSELLESGKPYLTEGSIIELIRRETDLPLDKYIENSALLFSVNYRKELASLYSRYIDIAAKKELPILLFTPTWRANPDRMKLFGRSDVEEANVLGVEFLKDIRSRYGSFAGNIYIGGLMGCKGDAYKPEEALGTEEAFEFHRPQVAALIKGGADFIQAATLPAFSEALGISKLLAEEKIPDLISFVTRPNGTLLDGTPLYDAMKQIDDTVDPKPTRFMVNCVHPDLFFNSLEHQGDKLKYVLNRLAGLQANASAMSPEELDALDHLESDSPDHFAASMLKIHTEYNLNLLGGCCGTSPEHLKAIADGLNL